MTIREYWRNRLDAIEGNNYEAVEKVFDEESALCDAWQNDEINISTWAEAHGVDVVSAKGQADLIQWMYDCDD